MKETIYKTLLNLGVPPHIKGYQYIGCAIELVLEDGELIHSITKQLYPTIAKKFDTTGSRVERAIRHAIEAACSNMKPHVYEEVFSNTVNVQRNYPTNSQFIATIAEYLRYNMKQTVLL